MDLRLDIFGSAVCSRQVYAEVRGCLGVTEPHKSSYKEADIDTLEIFLPDNFPGSDVVCPPGGDLAVGELEVVLKADPIPLQWVVFQGSSIHYHNPDSRYSAGRKDGITELLRCRDVMAFVDESADVSFDTGRFSVAGALAALRITKVRPRHTDAGLLLHEAAGGQSGRTVVTACVVLPEESLGDICVILFERT